MTIRCVFLYFDLSLYALTPALTGAAVVEAVVAAALQWPALRAIGRLNRAGWFGCAL